MSDFWRRAQGNDLYVEAIQLREKRDKLRESLQQSVKTLIRNNIQHEGNVSSAAGLWPGTLEAIFRHEFTGKTLSVVVEAIFAPTLSPSSSSSSSSGAMVSISSSSSSGSSSYHPQIGSASVLGAVGATAVRNSLVAINTSLARPAEQKLSDEIEPDAVRCMTAIANALNRSQLATLLESLLNESSASSAVVRREYSEKAFLRQQEEVGFMIALLHSLDPLPFVLPTRSPQINELLLLSTSPNNASLSLLSSPRDGNTSSGSNSSVNVSDPYVVAQVPKKKVARKKVAVITDSTTPKNSRKPNSANDDDFWNIEPAVLVAKPASPPPVQQQMSTLSPVVATAMPAEPIAAPAGSLSTQHVALSSTPALTSLLSSSPPTTSSSSLSSSTSSASAAAVAPHHEDAVRAVVAAAALLEDLDLDSVVSSSATASAATTSKNQTGTFASSSTENVLRDQVVDKELQRKIEWERLVAEQKKRIEQELQSTLEKEKAAAERVRLQRERERQEQERIEQERLEKERLEKEQLERERLAKEREERERLEREREEAERAELLEKERLERAERLKKEAEERARAEKEREEELQRELAAKQAALEEQQREEQRATLRAQASQQWADEVARMQAEVRSRVERENAARKSQLDQQQAMQRALAASAPQPLSSETQSSSMAHSLSSTFDGVSSTLSVTPPQKLSASFSSSSTSGVAATVLAGLARVSASSSSPPSAPLSNSLVEDDIASILRLSQASTTASPLKPTLSSAAQSTAASSTFAAKQKVRQSFAPKRIHALSEPNVNSNGHEDDEQEEEEEEILEPGALTPLGRTAVQSVLTVGGDGFSFFDEVDSNNGSSSSLFASSNAIDTALMHFRRTVRVAGDHSDLFSMAYNTLRGNSAAPSAASRAAAIAAAAGAAAANATPPRRIEPEITMEPLSTNPLGASPETSKLSVSPASASVASSSGLKSRFQSSALEEAKQQGFTWMPPRKQLYFTLERQSTPEQQEFLCAVCGAVMLEANSRRYCEYLNRWCCLDCHVDDKYYIPARILHNWDFKQYSVSVFAYTFLVQVHKEPVFDLQAINPAIYLKDPLLSTALAFRRKLLVMKNYVLTCREQSTLMGALAKLHLQQHMVTASDLYSLKDLLEVKKGTTPTALKSLYQTWGSHFQKCELCKAKRMICEICSGKEGLFFPWEKNLSRCTKCASHYHRKCAQGRSCPKCDRLARRAKPSSGNV